MTGSPVFPTHDVAWLTGSDGVVHRCAGPDRHRGRCTDAHGHVLVDVAGTMQTVATPAVLAGRGVPCDGVPRSPAVADYLRRWRVDGPDLVAADLEADRADRLRRVAERDARVALVVQDPRAMVKLAGL